MNYKDAKRHCHVRSSIRRIGNPDVKYPKNHTIPLDKRVSKADQMCDDWEEYDPREHEECSRFNETPA